MSKTVILLVFGTSVYIGMQLERRLAEDRCLAAGGTTGVGGLCIGVTAE